MAKYWKMGDRWAGIDKNGNRFVVDTKKEAKTKAGSSTGGKRSRSKGGRSMGKNLRLGTLAGAVVGASSGKYAGKTTVEHATDGDLDGVMQSLSRAYGYDAQNGEIAKDRENTGAFNGVIGLAVGLIASKGASKLGLNRYLPKGINI